MMDFNMPKLGFGFMRLPMKDGAIDYAALNSLVDEYIANGFSYFDTAYVYHGGESERAVKTAVVDRFPRESFAVADKLPAWELSSKEDIQRVFNEQLERTGAGYFDYYLLHSVEATHLKTYDKFDCWNWAREMKEKGLIKHFGFSYHDSPELLDKVLTDHPEVEFVQLQINYVDWNNKIVHSGGCYEVARKHNVPIIVMEPIKGGMLASMRPEWEAKFKAVTPDMSIASWAMRFCLSLDGVSMILSGMGARDQLRDNVTVTNNFKPFSEQEKAVLDEITAAFLSAPNIGCTACKYCIDGCPAKINIPGMLSAYNTVLTYGDHDRPHYFYEGITSDSGLASACIKCGKCEGVCPQHLNISELMAKTSAIFDVEW